VRQLVLLLAAVLAGTPAAASDLLDLYRVAVSRDTTLQAAAAQRDAAIEAHPQAVAQWLPQVLASGSAARERVEAQGQAPPGEQPSACSLSSTGLQRCYGNEHAYTVSLSQTIWSFESFSLVKEASRQVASAQEVYASATQDLVLRVASAYFRILAADDQLATASAERADFARLLEQAKNRQQTGVGPRSDVAQAQSFYDATEQSVIDAANLLDDAKLACAEIVGRPVGRVAVLREEIPLKAPDPESVDDWVSTARRDNPGIRAASLTTEAADYDISAQRGKGLPSLALTASGSQSWQSPLLGGNQSLGTIGLSIAWPLFQGGAVNSAVRQSRAVLHQAQAQYESLGRDVERQTRAAYRNTVSGIQRIQAARRAVDSAKAAVDASQRNVEFGTGTEFDLLNAQNNYSTVLRAYSQTRYDYLSNLLTLKQQAGHLTENDLAEIDALLVSAPGT
jgi:outer membrane protein